jgi:glycosyltransferase involved in cell wall biosynthesis
VVPARRAAACRLTIVRIAILGTRGIPANYGGFETFAEELGARLAARGHDVSVYGRSHYVDRRLGTYRGVTLVVLPTIRHKYFDTVAHTALATLHAASNRYDVVLMCNAANALFCAWPRPRGARVVLNVDGIERRRRKWNVAGRAWYLASERLATWLPDAVVTDARTIREYYARRYGAETTFIPYGCTVGRTEGREALDRFGLEPGSYVLYVSRLEPENNALAVIEGFERTKLDRRLVVVGDAPYAREYIAALRRAAGPRVVFTGGVYGEGYRQLQSHAFAYVHATEVGGTHPALVEAMGFGNCVVVHDVPENREVAGDAAEYFVAGDPVTLARVLEHLDRDSSLLERRREAARDRARDEYSWDAVTDQYEQLFVRLHGRLEKQRA